MTYATHVPFPRSGIPRESSKAHRPNDKCESAQFTSNAVAF